MKSVRTFLLASGGIFLMYALGMGVIPGFVLSATPPTPGLVDLTAQAKHGRDLYVGNGCTYCHTQQVRPLAQDKLWGRPSVVATTHTHRPNYWAPSAPGPT